MYNKAILMGRICNDLEIKTTTTGVSVLSFTIAVDRAFQEKGKDRVSDFFTIVAWRNTAEFISRFFSKGKLILIEGEIQNRKFTDNNGNERQVTEIVADTAKFTGERSERSETKQEAATAPTTEKPTVNTADDSDYPF